MKVLMTADTVGGVWTYSLELAGALNCLGVQTALATMGRPLTRDQKEEAAAAVPNLEIFESAFKLEWMDDPWQDVERAGEWLLDLEASLQPDIIHLNGYAHGALPWRAPTLVVGHSCVLSWWQAVRGEDAPPEWDRYREVVTQGLRSVSRVIAPTAAMLGALEQHYGPFSPAQVIPNGRTAALFAPGKKQEFVFSAGRLWDQAKNLAALEQVAPHLAWPVYVAGEQAHPEGGVAPAGSVRPLGRLRPEAVADWLARAAVYALPARYEPFGLSVLEAALAGCALVLGDIPSLRENWDEAAVFVPPDDTDALEAAISGLMHDPDRCRAMAARARFRTLDLSSQAMAARYRSVYDALVRERSGKPPCPPAAAPLGSHTIPVTGEVPACAS